MCFRCCRCHKDQLDNCDCTGEKGGHFCFDCKVKSTEELEKQADYLGDGNDRGIRAMDKYPKERDERYRANNDDPTMDYYQESKDTQQRAEEVTGLTLEARGHAVAVRGLLRDKAEKYDYIHLRVQGASTRATKGSSSSAHEGPREVNRQRGGRRGGGRGGGGERGGGKGKSKGKDKGKEKDRR